MVRVRGYNSRVDQTMRITVNGETRDIGDGATVADLVAQFQLTPERVAVEVNERLVRRVSYGATRLAAGDSVEIVTLVGGG
jgi:sulfur carrier protein